LPKLSIVFLNYNRLAETRKTVRHLQTLLKNRKDIEVIAVDNASSDGTAEYLQTLTDTLTVVNLDCNAGIAGLNAGFRRARGEYIMVLDDDSHPYDNAALDYLIECLDTRREVGVVACRIEDGEGRPVRTWHLPENDIPGTSTAFVGCGFGIRRELFESVGWYPERFFLYQNEVEVAIRVRQKGWEIFYEPRCLVVHRESPGGRTNRRRVFFPTRNTIWIIRRYFPFPEAAYMIASRLCMGLIRAFQSGEFVFYTEAVKEAFSEPIERDILPRSLCRQFGVFRKQNSVLHQIVKALSK